jgi:hypothetical protein
MIFTEKMGGPETSQVMGVFEGTELWDRFLSTRAELYRLGVAEELRGS